MKNAFHLYQSKNILNRKRTSQLYREAAEHDIISVMAGPGYGKTQSVMSYVSEQDTHIIWVPFSQLDNHTTHFWENFCNALSIIDEPFSHYCLKTGFPDNAGTMYRFLEHFQKNIDESRPLFIVFDDCHLIEESAVVLFIYNLITTISNRASIFLISRTVCLLNAENNLQGQSVKVVDENILAFTIDEIAGYFQLMSVPLPPNLLHAIYKKTEGWPIAVSMFALYGSENPAAVIASPQLTDDILLTMIEREIFSKYTPEDQKLLLKLSLLDFLPTRYIEEIYGKDALVHIASNLLVRYNAHSNSYSIHQLLKDFLKKRSNRLGEAEIQNTYKTAANWFMKYNLIIDALHCYEYLEDDQSLWHIVWGTLTDSAGPSRELLDYIHKILNTLTDKDSFHNAWLPLAKAIYYTFIADYDMGEKSFHEIIEDYSVSCMHPDTEKIVGEALLNIALIRMLHGDVKFQQYFSAAQKLLPEGSVTQPKGRMIVLNGDTIILHSGKIGEMDAWIQAHKENTEAADHLLHNAMHGMADMVAAQACYYRGHISKAEQFALTALNSAKERRCIDIVGNSYYLLEKICMYRGDYKKALEYIETSYAYMEQYNENPYYNLPEIAEGYFFIQIEKGEAVKDWIINESLYYKSLLSTNYGQERLLKGQYLLAEQRYSELFVHLDYTRKIYEQSHRYIALIYTYLLYCFAYSKTGNSEKAVTFFETAYKMAAPNDIIMPFVEMAHYTRSVCGLVRTKKSVIPSKWLDMIQAKATTYRKRMQLLIHEHHKEQNISNNTPHLTDREKTLLFLSSQGLTQNELAEELRISKNTVKSMQRGIYAKLGAINTTHAVYIAMKNKIIE